MLMQTLLMSMKTPSQIKLLFTWKRVQTTDLMKTPSQMHLQFVTRILVQIADVETHAKRTPNSNLWHNENNRNNTMNCTKPQLVKS